MSKINITQIKNTPKAAPRSFILFDGSVNVWSNSAKTSFLLPAGTSADRPASPVAGEFRYNTTSNGLEFFDGTIWKFVDFSATGGVSISSLSVSGQSVIVDVSGTEITYRKLNDSDTNRIETVNNAIEVSARYPLSFRVTQSAHGFSNGQAIYLDNDDNTWKLANAAFASSLAVGIADVKDSNTFVVVVGGLYDKFVSLSAGEYYYVSNVSAGDLTSSAPSTGYENPLVFALSQNTGFVLPWRPSEAGTSGPDINLKQGFQSIWIPSGSMLGDLVETPDYLTVYVTAASLTLNAYSFSPSSAEFVLFPVSFPKSWDNKTVKFQFYYTAISANPTGNTVVFEAKARRYNDGDFLGGFSASPNLNIIVPASAPNPEEVKIVDLSSINFDGNSFTDDLIYFTVGRNPTNSNDNFSNDIQLIGIKVLYNVDKPNDN